MKKWPTGLVVFPFGPTQEWYPFSVPTRYVALEIDATFNITITKIQAVTIQDYRETTNFEIMEKLLLLYIDGDR